MNPKRAHFLNHWSPYPEAPPNTCSLSQWKHSLSQHSSTLSATPWIGGTLFSISKTQVTLESQGFQASFETSHIENFEVFIPGDKVIIQQHGQSLDIRLLAPQLTHSPISSAQFRIQRQWQIFISEIRNFFLKQNFCEIQTPSLVKCPGFEPTIEPFQTQLKLGSKSSLLCLPTSPELHLKKALAAGWTEIFEIKSCFRNGEITDVHQPEFTMLEWYRTYVQFPKLFEDLIDLIVFLSQQIQTPNTLKQNKIINSCSFEKLSVAEIFLTVLGFELLPSTTAADLKSLCQKLKIEFSESDHWNDLYHRIWIDHIDPWLETKQTPILVFNFPAQQAALARLNPKGWADRLELYWKGLEIANGFHELNDPKIQEDRIQEDLKYREQIGGTPLQEDPDFIQSLKAGMPPGVGIAVGLERLFMALYNVPKIQEVKLFPY